MAVQLNDNIKVNAGKPVDSKYLNLSNVAYVSVAEAIVTIPISERHIGLTVNVAGVEYFWKNGVNDTDLVIKETQINLNLTGTGVTMTVTHAAAVNQPLTGAAVAVPDLNSAPTNGDTILCYAQTVVTQNGIYVYNSAGSWTRSTAMDNISEVFTGMTIKVDSQLGNNKDAVFMLTSRVTGSGALGSLPLVFTKLTNNASNYSLPNRITGVDNTILGGYGNSIVSGTTFNTFAQPVSVINGYNNTITGTSASAEGLTVIGLSGQSITWNSSGLGNTVMVPALQVNNILNQSSNSEDLIPLYANSTGYLKKKVQPINNKIFWKAGTQSSAPFFSQDVLGWNYIESFDTQNYGSVLNVGQFIRYNSLAAAGSSIGTLNVSPGFAKEYSGNIYTAIFSCPAKPANTRFFVGLSNDTAIFGNVQPSTLINTIYFGCDAGESTIKLGYNDGLGTATIVDTTIAFSVLQLYYVEIETFQNSNNIKVFISQLGTLSNQTFTTIISTNVPAITTSLYPQVWFNNGSTASPVQFSLFSQELTFKFNG